MKRNFSILIVIVIVVGVIAAYVALMLRPEAASDAKLSIVTTIFPQYDFTRQIVGEHADVTMLLKPGAESHSFEPAPQDIKKIQNADLFIYTGGENDVWVDRILASMGDKKPKTLKLVDCVPVVTEEIVPGMEHEHEEEEEEEAKHDHGEDEIENDEHVWTSPKNAIKIVARIAQILEKEDSANASAYAANSAAYISKLRDLDKTFYEAVKTAKRKTLLFGDRFPFRYFADAYGLKYYAAFTGCSTETEASAATVAFLTDKVKKEKIPVVFTIELSNGKIADSICDATGAKRDTLHSCHNVSAEDFAKGATYLSLMQQNAAALRKALN